MLGVARTPRTCFPLGVWLFSLQQESVRQIRFLSPNCQTNLFFIIRVGQKLRYCHNSVREIQSSVQKCQKEKCLYHNNVRQANQICFTKVSDKMPCLNHKCKTKTSTPKVSRDKPHYNVRHIPSSSQWYQKIPLHKSV